MSIINSDGLNTNWQLNVLKGLQGVIEQLTKTINISGDVNATIVAPLGSLSADESVAVALCQEQYMAKVKPNLLISSGDAATTIPAELRSISFASNGTADALISVDGGVNYLAIPTGTTINLDAGGLGNIYPSDSFGYDTATNAGSSLIITYNS